MPSVASLRRFLPAASWTALVAVLLALPGDGFPDVGPGDWLDKPLHAALFAVHFALLARALAGGPMPRGATAAALGSAVFALLMETVQLWVPGRGWEWWDLAAGFAGIAAAGLWLRRRATLPAPS